MEYIKGDITKTSRINEIVCHGCNCSGGFGSGVAGAIKREYPQVFERFKKRGASPAFLGTADIITLDIINNFHIANCYTQLNYGYDGKQYADLGAIESSLRTCFEFAKTNACVICSPKIGAGLGGLSWENEVEPIFYRLENYYKIPVKIYYF